MDLWSFTTWEWILNSLSMLPASMEIYEDTRRKILQNQSPWALLFGIIYSDNRYVIGAISLQQHLKQVVFWELALEEDG